MTAEIAIMNKMGIALAADSAVSSGAKIYNSVNKLFMLSKYEPVGIMIYDNASFMGIPWETIIKLYREQLGKENKPYLLDYAQDLIEFIKKEFLGSKGEQKQNFRGIIQSQFLDFITSLSLGSYIGEKIAKMVEKHGQEYFDKDKDNKRFIQFILGDELKQIKKQVNQKWGNISKLPKSFITEITQEYNDIIENEINYLGKQMELSEDAKSLLKDISVYSFYDNVSGVVIAGFGKNEIFPSIFTYTIAGSVNYKLKYMLNCEECSTIDHDKSADIIPFAQHEMVDAFTKGVTPLYHRDSEDYLKNMFDNYPQKILEIIDEIDGKGIHIPTINKVKEKIEEIKDWQKNFIEEYNDNMEDKKEENYTDILNAVMALPKDEMALMAESLVHITSLKRKFTYRDIENVGGAIDVAIISKGDGFVWFKRKHYFKQDLNHHFFKNYYNPANLLMTKSFNNKK